MITNLKIIKCFLDNDVLNLMPQFINENYDLILTQNKEKNDKK
jgi:hypothetical protein